MDPNNPNPGPGIDASQSAKAADATKDLRENLRQILRDGNDFNDIIKDQVRELGKLTTHYNKVRASIDGFRTSSLDVKRIQQDINKTKSQEFVQASKILETGLKLRIAGEKQFKGAEDYLKILDRKEQKEEQIREAAERGDRSAITSLKTELDLIEAEVAAESEMLTPLQGEYIARTKSQQVLKLTTKELQQQLLKEKEIKNSIGLTGIAFENFSKKLGFGDSVYEAMIDKARELQAQNEANGQKQQLRNQLIAKNKGIADENAAKRAAAIGEIEELREKNKVREAYNIQAIAQGRKPIDLFTIPDIEDFIKTTEAYKPKDLFIVPKTEGFFSKLKADFEAIGKAEELREKNKRIEAINLQREAQGKEPIPLFEIPKTDGFFSKLNEKFSEVKQNINNKGFFASLKDGLVDSGKSLGTSLQNGGKKAFNSLKAAPAQLLTNFKVFGAGLGAMFTGALNSLKDPAVLGAIALKIGKSLSNAFAGATKMLSNGMKSIGGELAEGPIQNLTKPISGFLEKIPLIGGLLGGVVDMMSTFMDLAVNANSQFVKMGRELGLDAAESQKLANNFSDIAQNSSNVFLNAKRLYEAQIDLSRQLGTTAIFSNEILSTNIKLKDILGLEEDIQASIAQASVITGKESQNIVGNVIQQVKNLHKAGLATQDYKAVLKEVSNLSGYLGLTFAKYPEKITKAVLQVKAMGLELKQVDSIADSFLDYESSISKEMEAQVLTGREMNLNKARQYALDNNLVGLAEEITKNAGSVNDFLKGDRFQAQATAEALGLSRDTLADMLKKSEFLKNIGAKGTEDAETQYKLAKAKYATLQDITNEQEKQQYIEIVSGTAQERLAALINKIKQGFIELTSNSSVTEFIDKAIKFMSDPSQIQGFVNGLKDFFATVLEGVGAFVNGAAKIANIFLTGKDEIAEDYGDTIKDFAQSLRSQSLGKLSKPKLDDGGFVSKPKLDDGGFVETSGVAEVHSGETYLGASSLQFIKMIADNARKTNEQLAKLVTQKSDNSNAQVRFVTGNVILDGVPTGKLILNSFQNNSYTNFDTTRYNS